jgi:hypothetical protein
MLNYEQQEAKLCEIEKQLDNILIELQKMEDQKNAMPNLQGTQA